MKKLFALRGAVCTENTKEAITENVCNMCNEIFSRNNLVSEDIVSIHFTMTSDLNVLNPATALRVGNSKIDITKCALFCSVEPEIIGMLPKTIRVMITTYADENLTKRNVYLNGAEKLRPDYKN